MTDRFSLIHKTRGTLPRVPLSVPFARIKDAALGPEYDLSLVFVGDAEARRLNIEHRGKDYIPNILSFELGPDAGEIFINPGEAKRQAKKFGRTPTNMIAFLYIHGLCHLKGMEHGATMERTEARLRKKFGI
ncbi:MAG: rRNA maturation RNase YbeY [Patescibacteria group bacterium]|nr:rRNA maturation RNase YbeY [Patescibacteria group bacterium]MDE2116624.1 rRNA maturation RNase YbeY [Patescibacteria group bacterium]